MSHAGFQQAIADVLSRDGGSDRGGRPAPDALPAALDGIDASRLAVHRNTFVSSLVDMLAETFPVTLALVGDDFFRTMARDCVLADPPRSPDLAEYALRFPDFIAAYSPLSAMPFVPELARVEALRLRAFHAADAEALDPAAFHALAIDARRLARTRLRLHPAAAWLRARHAVHALWTAHDCASDMHAVDLAGIDLDAAQDVLAARHGFELRVLLLPAGGADFLDALAGGETIAAAAARAIAADPRAAPAALFSMLLGHGLAVELHEHPLPLAQDSACAP